MLSVSEETFFRGVAQLASASGLGPEGPVFESQYPDRLVKTAGSNSGRLSFWYDWHYPPVRYSSSVFFGGEVNHFPAFLVHFPAGNVDSTALSPFFPGKVNHFPANQVHFPAIQVHFPLRLLNADSQRIHKVGYTSRFHFVTDKATSREKNDKGHDEGRKIGSYRHIFHPMSILLSLIILIISKL